MPRSNQKNVKLAGSIHQRTQVHFDERGFPIFDKWTKFTTTISEREIGIRDRDTHMRAATVRLRDAINQGTVKRSLFNTRQLQAIQRGLAQIPGLVWHHHQNRGRMQLVNGWIHEKTGHVGGFDLWYPS